MRFIKKPSRKLIRVWRKQHLPQFVDKGWGSREFYTALQTEVFVISRYRESLDSFLKLYVEGWDYRNSQPQEMADFLTNNSIEIKRKITQFLFKNASKEQKRKLRGARKLNELNDKVDFKKKQGNLVCYGADVIGNNKDESQSVEVRNAPTIIPKFAVNFESDLTKSAYDSLLTINSMIGMSIYSYINSLGIKEIPIEGYKNYLKSRVKKDKDGVLVFSHLDKASAIRKQITKHIDSVLRTLQRRGDIDIDEMDKYCEATNKLTRMFKNLVIIDTEHLKYLSELSSVAVNNTLAVDKLVLIENNMKASGIVKPELDSEAIDAIEDIRKRVGGSLMEKQLGVIQAGTFIDNDS